MNGPREQIKDNPAGLAGQRLTAQRLLLLDLLRQGEHLDADELYRRAREKEPRLSMSTVYRNLQLFKKLGLVQEHYFSEARSCYEARAKGEHHHLICLSCGKTVEFECPLSQKMKENLEVQNGFHITGAEVLLIGFCAECSAGKERVR